MPDPIEAAFAHLDALLSTTPSVKMIVAENAAAYVRQGLREYQRGLPPVRLAHPVSDTTAIQAKAQGGADAGGYLPVVRSGLSRPL